MQSFGNEEEKSSNRGQFVDRLGEPRQVTLGDQEAQIGTTSYSKLLAALADGEDAGSTIALDNDELVVFGQQPLLTESDDNIKSRRDSSPTTSHNEVVVTDDKSAGVRTADEIRNLRAKKGFLTKSSLSIIIASQDEKDYESSGDDGEQKSNKSKTPRRESWRFSASHTPVSSAVLHPFERRQVQGHKKTICKFIPSKRFAAQFDMVIVFPVVEHAVNGQSHLARYVMHTMLTAGLEIFPFLSVQDDEIVVLIRCPTKTLQVIAEKSGFKLECDPAVTEELLNEGSKARRIAPLRIRHEPEITPIRPYDHVYLRYQQENDPRLYKSHAEEGRIISPFTQAICLKLIHYLLTAPKRLGGCNLQISRYLLDKTVLALFPLHDHDQANRILIACMKWNVLPWQMPIEELRNYLGEKISLFTAFLGHMSYWYLPIAIIGVVVQIVVWISNDYSHPILPIWSVLIIIWSIVVLMSWKRAEATIALRWGMTEFISTQIDRPEYFGTLQPESFIDGREMLYFPQTHFRKRLCISLFGISSFVMLVLGVITVIYVMKFSLQPSLEEAASGLASILNVMQILLLNIVYKNTAIALTEQENHRTESEYEDALILKVFVFQFINSYASLFFLAFVAPYLARPNGLKANQEDYVGQCGASSCMQPLALTLGVIIASRIFVKNSIDVIIPYIKYFYTIRKETAGVDLSIKRLTPAEMDYILMTYDATLESVHKYSDCLVEYGYAILFTAALPLGPLLMIIYYHIKLKVLSWVLLTLHKRPLPVGAQSIESWQTVFTIISLVSVVTNAAVMSFTMTTLSDRSFLFRVWVFIGFQWLMLGLQYMTSSLIAAEPEIVTIQKARIKVIGHKLVDKFEDDDYDKYYTYSMGKSDDDNDKFDEVEDLIKKQSFVQALVVAEEEAKLSSGKMKKNRPSSYMLSPSSRMHSHIQPPQREQSHFQEEKSCTKRFLSSLHDLVGTPDMEQGEQYHLHVKDHSHLHALDVLEYPKHECSKKWQRSLDANTTTPGTT